MASFTRSTKIGKTKWCGSGGGLKRHKREIPGLMRIIYISIEMFVTWIYVGQNSKLSI